MDDSESGFTLSELLVSIAVLVALVLLFSRLFVSGSNIIASMTKRMETDGQVRPWFERLALDFALMIRRPDVDFFGKGTTAPNSAGGAMQGNDQLAFFSAVPGYHPSAAVPSPISLVAYRIRINKAERMAKGLLWNGASASETPMLFLPRTISGSWLPATNNGPDPDYENIGPSIFRFEYYYALKNGTLSVSPSDIVAGPTAAIGLRNVVAIHICVAALDPKSRQLISDDQLATLGTSLADFESTMAPGQLRAQWQSALKTETTLPRASLAAVRSYERSFTLSPGE